MFRKKTYRNEVFHSLQIRLILPYSIRMQVYKQIMLSILALLLLSASRAQVVLPQPTDQHRLMMGTSLGFNLLRIRQTDDSWLWWSEIGLLPRVGYFIRDNLAVGIRGEYFFSFGNWVRTPQVYSGGYWLRYYLPVKRRKRFRYMAEDGSIKKIKVLKDTVKIPFVRFYAEFIHTYTSEYFALEVKSIDSLNVLTYPNVHYLAAGPGVNIRINKQLHMQLSVWSVYFLNMPDSRFRFLPNVWRIGLEYFFPVKKSP